MDNTPQIVIAGLGPGPQELTSLAARDAVRGAPRVHTATPGHEAVRQFADVRPLAAPLRDDPEAAARFLVEEAASEQEPLVFAVPGSPYVLEPVVARLLADCPDGVRVIPAVSFLDTLWSRLGVDPYQTDVHLVPAATADARQLRRGQAVLTGLTAPLAARIAALAGDDPEAGAVEAVVAYRIGLPGERLSRIPVARLAEVADIDEYTSLYLPGAPAPRSALARALESQQRGMLLGYGMPNLAAALADVEAELEEVREDPGESEVGDVIYAAVQVSRVLEVDPDEALNKAVRRFTDRLDYIEGLGEDLTGCSPKKLRELWAQAKRHRD
ncbi:SAM-dependent methyltransferase [Streptomyces diastaticus]|uniref:SAM-dependent methyltransferase n=1 Tax=Streptomyces diastaticus TaxID=1956 RepID=UPI00364FEEA8